MASPPSQTRELLRLATAGSVDDGKSTLIGRLLLDTKLLLDRPARRLSAATATAPTSPRSPTGCAPSASRASRSTSPTASSTTASARSSSPTPRATSATRATWSPAPRPPISRSMLDRRPQRGVVDADAPPRPISGAARDPARGRVREQDGPRRLGRGALPRRSRPRSARSPSASTCRTRGDPDHARCTATTSSSARERAPWYDGPPLLEHLETVDVAGDRDTDRLRLPIQWVDRGPPTAATSAPTRGQLAGGTLRPGDEVTVLPVGLATTVVAIDAARRRGRSRGAAAVGHGRARGRGRRRPRRPARPRRRRRRSRRASSRRPSAGWPRSRCARGAATRSSTRRARVRATVQAIHDRVDAETLETRPTRASSGSTTSAASRCARARRSSPTRTPTTASPARSSSSTSTPTTRSAPGIVLAGARAPARARRPRRRDVTWHPSELDRAHRWRRAGPARRDGLADRAARLGQVDDRGRARAPPRRGRPRRRTCSTATTSATACPTTSASRPATAPSTSAASATSRG